MKNKNHFNWIQLAVELWEKDTFVSCLFNDCFKHQQLIDEVILLAQKSCHTTISIFPWTDRSTLGTHCFGNIKPVLFKDLLKSFGLTIG